MPNFNRKVLEFALKVCLGGCDAPPPPPPPSVHHPPSPFIIFMFCCLAATFSSVCYIATLKVCRAFRSRPRMRSHGNTNQDFIHEEQGSIVFHPIWLINTIGLDQSAIDSIKVIEYRKGDRLIDGTDCAVCLGEFQDEDSLRLLPNCSHAFHVSCIDTWLRSHKTCPVCRAPVVNDTTSSRLESNPIEEEIPMGNQSRRAQNPQEIQRNNESLEQICLFVDGSSSGVRVLSDLTDRRPQQLLQSVRRSVSMDSFAAVSSQEKKPNGLQKSTKRRGLTSSISICSRG